MRAIAAAVLGLLIASVGARAADDLPPLAVMPMGEGVWRHISHITVPGWGVFPCNGLIVEGPTQVVVIETPVDERQAQALLDWIAAELGKPVGLVLASHGHDDALGGLDLFHAAGAHSLAHRAIVPLARRHGLPLPRRLVDATEQSLVFDGLTIILFYPGPGHSFGNSVFYLPDRRILFGGCLIRSGQARSLGNLADAHLDQWHTSLANVAARFGQAVHVVPGHGAVGGLELVTHSQSLVQAAQRTAQP